MACIADTTTVDLTQQGGTLTAEVKVSADPNNAVAIHGDGLYVAAASLLLPTGIVWDYAGLVPPAGWLFCDGAAVSRSLYPDLFAVIGTLYGSGDGSTTFNVPDAQGRATVGVGTNADVSILGASDSLPASSRSPKHNTGSTGSVHTHTVKGYGVDGAAGAAKATWQTPGGTPVLTGDPPGTAEGSHTHGPGGSRPTDMIGYVALYKIIKT